MQLCHGDGQPRWDSPPPLLRRGALLCAALCALSARAGAAGARLAYLSCDYPACDLVVLSALDLATNASSALWSLPSGRFDDEYTGNSLLADDSTLVLSLQFDAAAGQGALQNFDLRASRPAGAALNVSSCVVLLLDPADPAHARLFCLRIVQGGPVGEETELRHIDRLTGADVLVATLFPRHSTFGEAALVGGLLYVPMAPLDGNGAFFIAAIDPATGKIVAQNATLNFTPVGLESEAAAGGAGGAAAPPPTALSVVRVTGANGQDPRAYLARVNLVTAVATQVGKVEFNLTKWTQLNPIVALDSAAGIFYLTAFEGAAGNALHLLGLSTADGAIVYDLVVRNPFCDLVLLPPAVTAMNAPPTVTVD